MSDLIEKMKEIEEKARLLPAIQSRLAEVDEFLRIRGLSVSTVNYRPGDYKLVLHRLVDHETTVVKSKAYIAYIAEGDEAKAAKLYADIVNPAKLTETEEALVACKRQVARLEAEIVGLIALAKQDSNVLYQVEESHERNMAGLRGEYYRKMYEQQNEIFIQQSSLNAAIGFFAKYGVTAKLGNFGDAVFKMDKVIADIRFDRAEKENPGQSYAEQEHLKKQEFDAERAVKREDHAAREYNLAFRRANEIARDKEILRKGPEVKGQ